MDECRDDRPAHISIVPALVGDDVSPFMGDGVKNLRPPHQVLLQSARRCIWNLPVALSRQGQQAVTAQAAA